MICKNHLTPWFVKSVKKNQYETSIIADIMWQFLLFSKYGSHEFQTALKSGILSGDSELLIFLPLLLKCCSWGMCHTVWFSGTGNQVHYHKDGLHLGSAAVRSVVWSSSAASVCTRVSLKLMCITNHYSQLFPGHLWYVEKVLLVNTKAPS